MEDDAIKCKMPSEKQLNGTMLSFLENQKQIQRIDRKKAGNQMPGWMFEITALQGT